MRKITKKAEKKSRKSSAIIGVNIVEEAPTKDKKRKKSNQQKSELAKTNFKGNCFVARLFIGLLIVVLQQRTKKKIKRKVKVKKTSWKTRKMQKTCVQ